MFDESIAATGMESINHDLYLGIPGTSGRYICTRTRKERKGKGGHMAMKPFSPQAGTVYFKKRVSILKLLSRIKLLPSLYAI